MGREYVIQTWVKHDKDDDRLIPDHLLDDMPGYSGEQVGNRLAKSNGSTVNRSSMAGWTADKKADLGYYADQNEVIKTNPLFAIDPAFKVLAEYQDKIQQLENALHTGTLTQSLYDLAVKVLDAKHEKAQQKLTKLIESNIEEDAPEETPVVYAFSARLELYTPTKEEEETALKEYFSC